jgi:hypothetical protein
MQMMDTDKTKDREDNKAADWRRMALCTYQCSSDFSSVAIRSLDSKQEGTEISTADERRTRIDLHLILSICVHRRSSVVHFSA